MIPIWANITGLMGLLNSVSFAAPLTHTAVPTRAASGTTATFTRATTATVRDNEGVLRTAIAGEARFEGARRVRNLIPTTSENFDNAAWTKTSSGGGSIPVITADQDANPVGDVAFADKVVFAAPVSGDSSFLNSTAFTTTVGNRYLGYIYVKAFAAGDVGKQLLIRHAGVGAYTTITLTANYQRVGSAETNVLASPDFQIGLRPAFGSSTGTVSVYLAAAMVEDITGRADQTTPSEYVSVGVVQRNVLLQTENFAATWVAVGSPTLSANALSSGGVSLSLVGDDDVGATEGYYQSVTFTGDGTKTVSIYVKEGTSAPAAGTRFYLYDNTAGANRAFGTITWVAGAPSVAMMDGTLQSSTLISNGVYRIAFTAPSVVAANANRLYLIVSGTAAQTGNIYAGGAQAENSATLTDYQAVGGSYLYHGAGVDGVKCFPTDLSGNPIAASTLLGYVAEGARTNLCLQSNAFTTTWTADNIPSIVQNAEGIDGGTTAWTFTNDATAGEHRIYQSLGSTASRTISIYAKAGTASFISLTTTGSGSQYAGFDLSSGTVTGSAGGTPEIEPLKNGFYRCSFNETGAAGSFIIVNMGETAAGALPGAAVSGTGKTIIFTSAQAELGSFASSYIPTTTIAVARNADVLTYSSAGNIDGTKGWCYAEVARGVLGTGANSRIISTISGSNTGPLLLEATTGQPRIYDGTTFATSGLGGISIFATNKIASRWGGSAMQVVMGGVVGTVQSFDGDLSPTIVIVGSDTVAGDEVFGTIRNVRIGQRQLSASELQAITA